MKHAIVDRHYVENGKLIITDYKGNVLSSRNATEVSKVMLDVEKSALHIQEMVEISDEQKAVTLEGLKDLYKLYESAAIILAQDVQNA